MEPTQPDGRHAVRRQCNGEQFEPDRQQEQKSPIKSDDVWNPLPNPEVCAPTTQGSQVFINKKTHILIIHNFFKKKPFRYWWEEAPCKNIDNNSGPSHRLAHDPVSTDTDIHPDNKWTDLISAVQSATVGFIALILPSEEIRCHRLFRQHGYDVFQTLYLSEGVAVLFRRQGTRNSWPIQLTQLPGSTTLRLLRDRFISYFPVVVDYDLLENKFRVHSEGRSTAWIKLLEQAADEARFMREAWDNGLQEDKLPLLIDPTDPDQELQTLEQGYAKDGDLPPAATTPVGDGNPRICGHT